MKYHYPGRDFTHRVIWGRQAPTLWVGLWVPSGSPAFSVLRDKRNSLRDPLMRDKSQMGSLAGAAYLLNDNAGVLNLTQWEQKSHVAHKGKSQAEFLIFSTNPDCESKA